jgi:hypothetical protein
MLKNIEYEKKLNTKYISNDILKDTNQYIAIYIDVENLKNLSVKKLHSLFEEYKFDPTQYLFIGCLSNGHHHAETDFIFEDIAFQKVLVPSTRNDAADIGMIMHALTHHSGKAHTIIFVSGDKFSCVFVELADKGFCTNNKTKFIQCSNFTELLNTIAST